MSIPSMNKPLSNLQKATLSQVAKQGYLRAKEHDLTDLSESEWRAGEAIEAVGVRISEASNGHFNKLYSHFLNLAGNSGAAFKAALRDETEEARQAMHKLTKELAAANLDKSYAEAICMSVFKCSLAQATPKQLWKVMFTIRSRAKKGVEA